jgi:lysophospholipid hydrolase
LSTSTPNLTDPHGQGHGSAFDENDEDDSAHLGRPTGKSRANSDVSQMGESGLGPARQETHVEATDTSTQSGSGTGSGAGKGHEMRRARSSSDSSAPTTARGKSTSPTSTTRSRETPASTLSPSSKSTSPTTSTSQSSPAFRPSIPFPPSHPPSPPIPHRGPSYKPEKTYQKLASPGREAPDSPKLKLGSAALDGTIARATVDTTLAVIPAEAFKKLTRKFPKASGTIVQVVLERFSRVTFMTGKFDLLLESFDRRSLMYMAHL